MSALVEVATGYAARGWIVHRLSSPKAEGASPGKRPIDTGWQKVTTPPIDAKLTQWFGNGNPKGSNIGMLCGKASGVTVIDLDRVIYADIFDGINTLRSARTTGRCHIFFKYNPHLPASKHHNLGIEVLANGNNAVLPPSAHESGDLYAWADPDAPLATMPEEIELKLTNLFKREKELNALVRKCRPCFNRLFKKEIREATDFHGAEGRELLVAWGADLKAEDATLADVEMWGKIIYGDGFDPAKTLTEWRNIDPTKTWKCETVRAKLGGVIDCDCAGCKWKTTYNLTSEAATAPDGIDTDEDSTGFRDTAIEIMKTGDPVEKIIGAFNEVHIGDADTGRVLMLSAVSSSVRNSDGIHPSTSGGSGKGKSHACQTLLHLIPAEYWIETSLSAKSLFYADIEPGMIIFSDDVELADELESTIRRATSNFQKPIIHKTIDGNRKPIELQIPPRVTWWLAAVDENRSDQMLNRQIGVGVDESPEMDAKVARHQLEKAKKGEPRYPVTDEVMICREIFRIIKANVWTVTVPFTDRIVWNDARNRRNLPIFLDFVKAFAVIRHLQREVTNGDTISATKEDYDAAAELYHKRAETQTSKLTKVELSILRVIHDRDGEAYSHDIEQALGLAQGRVHQLLHGQKGRGGLLAKVPGLHFESVSEVDAGDRRVSRNVYKLTNFDVLGSYASVVSYQEEK